MVAWFTAADADPAAVACPAAFSPPLICEVLGAASVAGTTTT